MISASNIPFKQPYNHKTASGLLSAICIISLLGCGGSEATTVVTTTTATTVTTPATVTESEIFYVSTSGSDTANDGSQASPWGTIQHGVDQLTAGQTLSIGAGTYTERVKLDGTGNSGSDGSPITLLADSGAIIDGSSLTPTGNEDALLTLNDVSYVVIDGLQLQNFKTAVGFNEETTPIGILVTGTTDQIEINNNIIQYIENNSTCTESDGCGVGANGIAVYGRNVNGITNISLFNNEVAYNITASSEAFVLNGNVNGFSVTQNYVHDNNNIGIDLIGLEGECSSCTTAEDRARNGIVSGNKVVNNSNSNFGGNPWYQGDTIADGIYVDGGVNIIIDGNYVTQNDLGIEIASEAAGQLTSDVIVRNNVIFKNQQAGLVMGGYNEDSTQSGGGSVDNILVYNNSFYKNTGFGTEIVLQYRVTNSQFYDNSIYATGAVSEGIEVAVASDLSNRDLVFKGNLWWGAGDTDNAPVNSTTALVADPLYTDPDNGDLTPTQSSPLINAGDTLTATLNWGEFYWATVFPPDGTIDPHGATDFVGNTRIVGNIDIGAYENQ